MNTKTSIFLRNAEHWSHLHPQTFPIPSRRSRRSVRTGDIVKLWFDDPRYISERMWVVVRECVKGQTYLGTLENVPASLPLRYGTWLRFDPRHILDIYADDPAEAPGSQPGAP